MTFVPGPNLGETGYIIEHETSLEQVYAHANEQLEINRVMFIVDDNVNNLSQTRGNDVFAALANSELRFRNLITVTPKEFVENEALPDSTYQFYPCTRKGYAPDTVARMLNLFRANEALANHTIIILEVDGSRSEDKAKEVGVRERPDAVFEVVIIDNSTHTPRGHIRIVKNGNMMSVYQMDSEQLNDRWEDLGEDIISSIAYPKLGE